MKQLIISLLLILTTITDMSARTLQGTVLTANDSTTLVGATCHLLDNDKIIAKAQTDAAGLFSLETSLQSALNLEISMEGFAPTMVYIEAGSKDVKLGKIYLDSGVTLQEVTVTAQQNIVSKGRTIIYPSIADVRASSSSLSLFQKLPLSGLNANPITRTLSVDGGTPMILIDGIPSTLDDFNTINPKDIAKVEYSRMTPARYADKGTNGVIMITLKQRNDGGQIYFWGRSAVNTAFVDANLRASYHQGPSQFSIFYTPSWRNYQKVYDNIEESYIGDDIRIDLKEHDRNPFNYVYHTMRVKYDFRPSEKTLFSATFRATPSKNKSRSLAQTIDSQLGEYDNENLSKSNSFSPSLDLFLRQDFNKTNSLEVQVVGTLSSGDYRRDNRYYFDDGTEETYSTNADSRRRSLISEISYIHDFSDKTQLSAGFQNTLSHSKNKYLTSDYEPLLTENNNFIYARLGQDIGNLYLSLYTGAKLFWIENDINKRHFIRNLSSIRLSWTINNHWNLQASFRYTPGIPSLSALTDYPQQTTPYLINNGNPDLKVTEYLLYTLQAGYKVKKFSLSFYSAIENSHNNVITDVRYIGDGLFLSQSVNTKRRRIFENDLTLRINDVHGFGASVYMNLTHYQTAGEGWSHNLTSFNGSLSLWWNKGPFTISYWRKLPGKYLNGQTVGKDENGDSLDFDWTPNKHWTIGVAWMYMFDNKGTRYPSWCYSEVNPISRERFIRNNGNMIVFSLTYNADFGSIFRTSRRNLNNSDNASSLIKF